MIKNRAGWLALAVLAIATLLMVFFVMPRISGEDKPSNDAVNSANNQVKPQPTGAQEAAKQPRNSAEPQQLSASSEKIASDAAKRDPLPAAEKTGAEAISPATAAKTASDTLAVPTFDVLRVEPDGSTVIAGRAAPGARIEVMDQATTVASTMADKAGEFVAILDKPLPPGDHQLVLKATTPDGKTVISEEIATVSVPQNNESELLAMVTKPGEASRILAKPASQAPASQAKTERIAADPTIQRPLTPAANQPATEAAAASQTSSAAPNAVGSASADLQVSAVEVEGNKLFVAGIAKPGARLKAYVNGQLLGQTTANADGSFVIDGTHELAVGEHKIAVDHVTASDQALVRVEVPFNRPAGDQVAAVASQQGGTPLTPIDAGAFDKLRNEVGKAFQLLQNLYANGGKPSMEQVAAARSAVTIALRSLTEYRLPAGVDANTSAIAATAIKAASDALTALEALPKDVDAVGRNLGTLSAMIARVTSSTLPSTPIAPQATTPAAPQVSEASPSAAPRTIEQAPLTKSDAASVIIRRGDTLWQISRRVYGQGVRYTTIYLANQDQIANPDIIQPGQIFGVPKEALPEPEAEKVHRERLKKG
ncbi:LysM peptidoglycan-binding domain-containing protein [Rhizobium helianthi]|uniref:LysM peptidoglycan-binding domain-containing protein n=1 Tax=Rhizobium helianthi TaxID=1132695 RepID=A0ABW4M5C0_9HYPH